MRSPSKPIDEKEYKKHIKTMKKQKTHEVHLAENFYLIRLNDSKKHETFYLVEKTSLGAGRPVYHGKKVNPVTGQISAEPFIIKYNVPADDNELDLKQHEVLAFRKLQDMDYVVAPHPESPEDMKLILQAMPWLGTPIQGYGEIENEQKQKVKSPDYLALDEKVKEYDPIDIIQQVLFELNRLHTETKDHKAYLWGDPKGENVVLRVVDGKPVISLIDLGDTRPVMSTQLQDDVKPPMTNWFFVKEKLENKQGVLSDFPPLVALFAQLLGAEDVLKDKREAVRIARIKAGFEHSSVDHRPSQVAEIEHRYNFEGMLEEKKYEGIKAPIINFLNWMQEKEYKERPPKDVPLLFFSKVKEYLAERDPQKKAALQKGLEIISSRTTPLTETVILLYETLGNIPKSLLDFLSKSTSESNEILGTLLAAGKDKVLIENILFAADVLYEGDIIGVYSWGKKAHDEKEDVIPEEDPTFDSQRLVRSELSSMFIDMLAHAPYTEIEDDIHQGGTLKISARNFIDQFSKSSGPIDPVQKAFLSYAKQYSETLDQKQKDIFLKKMFILNSTSPERPETKALLAIEEKCKKLESHAYLDILTLGNDESKKFAQAIIEANLKNDLNEKFIKKHVSAHHLKSPHSPQSHSLFQKISSKRSVLSPISPTPPKLSEKHKGPLKKP